MSDTTRLEALKNKLARQSRIPAKRVTEQSGKPNSSNDVQELRAKLKIEITDKIEIRDRKWLSTENWIG
jgi:hypothetical protein